MIRSVIIIVLVVVSGIANLMFCQEDEAQIIQTDTLNVSKKTQVIGVPIIFYTPETSFGIGGGVQLLFNGMKNVFNSRLSDMMITAVYTAKNQLLIDARPKIHIFDGHFYLEGIFRYKLFPNSFWGIGNNTLDSDLEQYNMESLEVHALLLKRIPPYVNFGFEYIFQNHKMLEYDPEGQLINEVIPGSEGAVISALSPVFTFDNRDNISSTTKGSYMQLNAGFSSKVLGSSYSYNKYKFDFRKFFLIKNRLTIAGQFYTELTYGEVPFQSMPWFGGQEKMRGYFRGRYIDNQFYTLQGELRWHILNRWILAGFVSGGNVSDYMYSLFENIKYSFGGGVRFQISKKSLTYVRLDIGFGSSGNSGIYFGVNEAF